MFKILLEGFRGNLFLICNQRDITMMSILIGSVKKKKKTTYTAGVKTRRLVHLAFQRVKFR